MIRLSPLKALIPVTILLASCAAPTLPPAPTATQTPSPAPTATLIPTATLPVTATAIPGFEDWTVNNPQAVDIAYETNALVLTLKHRALWFMSQRGVLFSKPVSGDFKITADVYTAKSSNPSRPPGGNGSVQLGGLMARNGNGGRENYVFIVVGDDGNGLSVETKTTLNSESTYEGPAWNAADAALRLCRFGQTFNLYKRHIGAAESWQLAAAFERPDLPDSLQVGINIYSDNEPDLQIRYENLTIEPISSDADCETD